MKKRKVRVHGATQPPTVNQTLVPEPDVLHDIGPASVPPVGKLRRMIRKVFKV